MTAVDNGRVTSTDVYADEPDLAALAGLLADRTRAAFCLALLDGRAWTATELARLAGVAPSTATSHLNRLVTGGLLAEERSGRHRYVRLADPGVAEMIEALAARAPHRVAPVRSLTAARRRRDLAFARVCFDHLAGSLAVAITDAMTAEGLLSWDHGPALTTAGADWLTRLGITDGPTGPAPARPHIRTCVDWSEQRLHLAGGLGAAVFRHAVEESWLVHTADTRVVRLTDDGRAALRLRLRLPDTALTPASRRTEDGPTAP
ncbi:winged helix-turn-helix domain-containing protein [Streptomyces sp. NPDC051771]|uniref:ArsR/SmtB family transcription factor n=1 Tax=Streptomyces sp. NPDC051771 TaxID=3154847 RepID=UPI0034228617